MKFSALVWLFAGAVTLHNAEEAIFLPGWSRHAGRWRIPVGAAEFRFAVVVLTLLVYGCAAWASAGGAIGAYLISGYALAMAINTFAPHLAATVATRRYAPGAATAVLFVLPVSVSLLRAAAQENRIAWSVFWWSGPLTALAILAAIPGLFRVGRMLFSPTPAADRERC